MAHGNTLYLNQGGGSYEEASADLGVAHAGWAWGQAWFDVDLDGDGDLYVASGNLSHTNALAPDY